MDCRIETRTFPYLCKTCREETQHAICHHCREPLCPEHAIPGDREHTEPSQEFTDLGLNDDQANFPLHCEDCAHHVAIPSWRNLVMAGGAVVLGLVLFGAGARWVGGIVILLAGSAAAWFWRQRQQAIKDFYDCRPPLPVVSLQKVSISESIEQVIHLTEDGTYTSTLGDIKGTLETRVMMGSQQRDALDDYVEKFDILPDAMDAGSIRCTTNGSTLSLSNGAPTTRPAIDLRQPVEEIEASENEESDAPWETRSEYVAEVADTFPDMPVLVIPSYEPTMNGQGIDIEVHWDPLIKSSSLGSGGSTPFEVTSVEKLAVKYPKELQAHQKAALVQLDANSPGGSAGHESTSDRLTLTRPSASDSTYTLAWENIQLSSSSGDTDTNALRATLMFRDSIAPSASSCIIKGSVSLQLRSLPTGVSPALYQPLGARYADQEERRIIQKSARILVNFELDLSTLRYQRRLSIGSSEDVEMILESLKPDSSHPSSDADEDVPNERSTNGPVLNADIRLRPDGSLFFERTAPNARTVLSLLDNLSERDKDFYIQNVFEEPPRSTESAARLNRYWDIRGRWYRSVWPVDFQITLMGEEEVSGLGESFGRSTVTLTTQGTYTNPTMKQQIAQTWINLATTIDAVMKDEASVHSIVDGNLDIDAGEGYQPTAETGDPPLSRGNGTSIGDRNPAEIPSNVSDSPELDLPHSNEAERDSLTTDWNWKQDLKRQLVNLRSKYLEGKISEEAYEKMRAEIRSDLSDFDT